MKKIVVFGVGENCKLFMANESFIKYSEILCFSDNNSSVWNQKYSDTEILIVPPYELKNYEFDYCIIMPSYYFEDIKKQLLAYGIMDKKIISREAYMSEFYLPYLQQLYSGSEDTEIEQMLADFEKNGVSIFGDFISKERKLSELSEVFRDNYNRPYIWYYEKKMYFPNSYHFYNKDGKEYVCGITYEQQEGSPHKYIRDNAEIKEGAVIVDAGVCEGNFALKYIEKTSKIYLIECDPFWIEALRLTFEPWKEKVVILDKFLDRYDSATTITLDTLVPADEKIDFLKMDIEGAEIAALLGGTELLKRSNATCAVCSYHKQNDEKNIRFLLESMGYKTSVSEGYMFFLWDENLPYTMDFRRGIVYGDKA